MLSVSLCGVSGDNSFTQVHPVYPVYTGYRWCRTPCVVARHSILNESNHHNLQFSGILH